MGVEHPSRQMCREVRSECAANALELRNGDLRTFAGTGFARLPSAALQPLFTNPKRRPSGMLEATVVQAERGNLKLRHSDGELVVSNLQVLWQAIDLEYVFKQRRSG